MEDSSPTRMKDPERRVFFISKNKDTALSIDRFIRNLDYEKNASGFIQLQRMPDGQPLVFENMSCVLKMFRTLHPTVLAESLIIIDYHSLYEDFEVYSKDGRPSPLATLLMQFPELNLILLRNDTSSTSIFRDRDEPVEVIEGNMLFTLNVDELLGTKGIHRLHDGISLKYDPSGLRNWLKRDLLLERIQFKKDNYENLHQSRSGHLAVAIDEEKKHAQFWGYSLYNFGYRVLPVTTHSLLTELVSKQNISKFVELICRDYDLQFPDLNGSKVEETLYRLRGLKRDKGIFVDVTSEYWREHFKHENLSTWIITQSLTVRKINFRNETAVILSDKVARKEGIYEKVPEFKRFGLTIWNGMPVLRGQSKELEGMTTILECCEVNERFWDSRDFVELDKQRDAPDSHGVPAFNGRVAEEMLYRAQAALRDDNFPLAALIASEAREVLNGLSMSLSLQALHLKLKAEALMELEIVGIGELKKNMDTRIFEIRRQIERLGGKNEEAKQNARMQIFNDLRKIYEEHEQFTASEALYEEVVKAELRTKDVMGITIERESESVESPRVEGTVCPIKSHKRKFIDRLRANLMAPLFWIIIIFYVTALVNYFAIKHFDARAGYLSNGFSVIYFILFLTILAKWKNLLYAVIGAGTNMKKLWTSFIIFNSMCIAAYYVNKPAGLNGIAGKMIGKAILSTLTDQIDAEPLSHFIDTGPVLIPMMHMMGSIFFLGIIISIMYRRFTRR